MNGQSAATDKKFYDEWWNCPDDGGDAGMEADHLDHWQHVISYLDHPIKESDKLLDFGCNRGGFMRMLYDHSPFAEGIGIDRARNSIAYAEANKGARPLRYELGDTADSYTDYFDFAVSTAVIYLIEDIACHARTMFRALKPGAAYYAQHPDYSAYPNQSEMVRAIDAHAAIPTQLKTLDQIASAFADSGFKVAIRRLPPRGFIPFNPGGMWYTSIYDKISASYDHAYMFKFIKPD